MDGKWLLIQVQNMKASGMSMNISVKELTKLKRSSVPITVATSLDGICADIFLIILYMISFLAEMKVTFPFHIN